MGMEERRPRSAAAPVSMASLSRAMGRSCRIRLVVPRTGDFSRTWQRGGPASLSAQKSDGDDPMQLLHRIRSAALRESRSACSAWRWPTTAPTLSAPRVPSLYPRAAGSATSSHYGTDGCAHHRPCDGAGGRRCRGAARPRRRDPVRRQPGVNEGDRSLVENGQLTARTPDRASAIQGTSGFNGCRQERRVVEGFDRSR